MSLTLYLLRHAQSTEKQLGEADKDRELTSQGMRESLQIGSWLKEQAFTCDLILCSTAVRARSTAGYLFEALNLPIEKVQFDDNLYNASSRTLFEQVTNTAPEVKSLMVIGHNPPMTYLAEYLTKKVIGDMVPGGLAMIQFNFSTWQEVGEGTGELIHYICPSTI